jgi:hypothetical protein
MKNPFEAPRQVVPKKEEKPKEAVPKKEEKPIAAAMLKEDDRRVDWTRGSARRKPDPVRGLAELEEKKQAMEGILTGYFEKYPFAKDHFEKDPESIRSFRAGLAILMDSSLRAGNVKLAGLKEDKTFQGELLKLSFRIEDEAKDRRRSARPTLPK